MKRLSEFLSPMCDSHPIGLWTAATAFMAMTGVAAVAAVTPGQLGFGWQTSLLAMTPALCLFGCLAVSVLSPVGNRSQITLIRGIGRIPVLGRYFVFVAVLCGTVFAMMVVMNLFAFSSIQSLDISRDLPFETWIQIREEVGEGVTFQGSGDEMQVLFLEEKRAAVERALEKESIAFEESEWCKWF